MKPDLPENKRMTSSNGQSWPGKPVILTARNLHTLMIYTPGVYEEHFERERAYSDMQLKDAKILDQLRRLSDFHPVVQK